MMSKIKEIRKSDKNNYMKYKNNYIYSYFIAFLHSYIRGVLHVTSMLHPIIRKIIFQFINCKFCNFVTCVTIRKF